MAGEAQDWSLFNSVFDSHDTHQVIELIPRLIQNAPNLSDLARSTKTLAELHLNPTKDPQLKKSTGYALISAYCQIELQRFAPAAALLDWLKKYKAPQSAIEHLTLRLTKAFSRETPPAATRASSPEITKLKGKTPLLSTLSESELRSLLDLASTKTLLPNEVLFKQGDAPTGFYIVADGEMKLSSNSGINKFFSEGNFFGEIALLGNHKRTATLTATKETSLLEFSKTKLLESFILLPNLEERLFQFYLLRLLLHFAPQHPFFSELSEEDLSNFFYFLKPGRANAGTILIQQGANSSRIFLILNGTATVEKDGKHLADIGAGEFVGEMGLMSGETRSARVTAQTTCDYLECQDYLFEPLCQQYPKLKDWLARAASQRLEIAD